MRTHGNEGQFKHVSIAIFTHTIGASDRLLSMFPICLILELLMSI